MKRMIIGMSIAGALLAIWGAAGLAQDKALKKVVFAVTTKDISVGHSAHSSLPQALGYWKEEGLDVMVTSVEGSAAGMQQLAAGNLQIVSLGPEEIVIGREKGVKIKGFYVQARETIYRLVVPADSPLQKVADLKGKTIGATRGAIEEQALTASAPPDATVKRFEDNNATIAAFVSGQVDLIATGNTVAAAIAEKLPARAPALKFVIKDSPCYVGLNKNEPALLAKVNEIITKAKASGDIAKLSEKWLKAPLPPGF